MHRATGTPLEATLWIAAEREWHDEECSGLSLVGEFNPNNPGRAAFGIIYLFLMVPLVAIILWAVRRRLPPSNRVRIFLEKRDPIELAKQLTLLLLAVAAVVVTLLYS